MRKKYLLMVIAGALVLATMIGGTLAALNVKSEEAATADISIKSVGVTIYDEQTPLGTLTEEKTTEIVPGTDVAMARKVVNSVSDGYDVYVKVVIYTIWEVDGEQLYPETGAADLLYVESGEKGRQDLAAAGMNEKVNGWIVQYADDEQIVMYYSRPVKPDAATSDFISGIKFTEAIGNEYANASYHMEYQVTAVQANNAADAIAAELGVFPVFDEDGNIIAISEEK